MDKSKFTYVTYIAATPEKVWNALMDAEMTKGYWANHRNVSDWKVGSTWSHQDYDTGVVDIVGKILEVNPPRRLVLTWEGGNEGLRNEKPSKVTFLIDPFMGAIRLTLIHDELEPDSNMFHGISSGWPVVLSSLKTMLETGRAMPMTARKQELIEALEQGGGPDPHH